MQTDQRLLRTIVDKWIARVPLVRFAVLRWAKKADSRASSCISVSPSLLLSLRRTKSAQTVSTSLSPLAKSTEAPTPPRQAFTTSATKMLHGLNFSKLTIGPELRSTVKWTVRIGPSADVRTWSDDSDDDDSEVTEESAEPAHRALFLLGLSASSMCSMSSDMLTLSSSSSSSLLLRGSFSSAGDWREMKEGASFDFDEIRSGLEEVEASSFEIEGEEEGWSTVSCCDCAGAGCWAA